ncbi:50s ribosomal protein L27, chloroplastic,related [Neospora caninum Liverpool]|uniref:50s ribosomal protein L27, chloroplastic,related n=1 Tax=Neospora caninum (strain Liverpool) TaxID=572307 RepID=F0V765_NEOCL|nr:50s ribosomal protein L27, chloroplastic,related [Neospora caninum Liverpool]CBZ49556.1 50s ribosomal protein L27, chloroplastic,related [Neospora caninum Liverpool]|eukprot:XP_003879591.1 50s ribosomal protein L27, chloroplastic,related [Neospora caninum Liverpool]
MVWTVLRRLTFEGGSQSSFGSRRPVHGLCGAGQPPPGPHCLLFHPQVPGQNDSPAGTMDGTQRRPGGRATFLWATKKGGGSTKNGRDSQPKFLGVKKFGGEFVLPGHILVRQRGTRYKAGDGVRLCRDDSLTAVRSGFVDFLPVYKFEYHFKKRRWLKRHRRRVHAGFLVSVLDSMEESRSHQKRQELVLLRTLSSSWIGGQAFSPSVPSSEQALVHNEGQEPGIGALPVHELMQEEGQQRRDVAGSPQACVTDAVETDEQRQPAFNPRLLPGAAHI